MAKNSSKHLLLIRISAMGDVAMVPHAVRSLRRSYPDLRISILTKELFRPLFDGLNVEIIPFDNDRHDCFLGEVRLAHELIAAGVTHVADIHGIIKTKYLMWILRLHGVTCRKIVKGRVSKWMRMDGGCSEMTKSLKHTVLRYCDTIKRLGFDIPEPEASVKLLNIENPTKYSKGEEKWIGVAPFSAHEGKRYPQHLIREVITSLADKYDRVFVHTGGGIELDFAKSVAEDRDNIDIVFGNMNLRGEINLIALEDCIVSMDSFAMHVASLTATPVVSVWGATSPRVGYVGYKSDPSGIVELELPCRPCSTYGNKPCRFGDYHCMHDIKPSTIIDRVVTMLER